MRSKPFGWIRLVPLALVFCSQAIAQEIKTTSLRTLTDGSLAWNAGEAISKNGVRVKFELQTGTSGEVAGYKLAIAGLDACKSGDKVPLYIRGIKLSGQPGDWRDASGAQVFGDSVGGFRTVTFESLKRTGNSAVIAFAEEIQLQNGQAVRAIEGSVVDGYFVQAAALQAPVLPRRKGPDVERHPVAIRGKLTILGKPLEGWALIFDPSPGSPETQPPFHMPANVVTSADGTFQLADVKPGNYIVRVMKPGIFKVRDIAGAVFPVKGHEPIGTTNITVNESAAFDIEVSKLKPVETTQPTPQATSQKEPIRKQEQIELPPARPDALAAQRSEVAESQIDIRGKLTNRGKPLANWMLIFDPVRLPDIGGATTGVDGTFGITLKRSGYYTVQVNKPSLVKVKGVRMEGYEPVGTAKFTANQSGALDIEITRLATTELKPASARVEEKEPEPRYSQKQAKRAGPPTPIKKSEPTPTPSSPVSRPANARFEMVKASYKDSLSIKINIVDKQGKTVKQSEISVANNDTGFPFIVVELALRVDEVTLRASATKLTDGAGKEYKLDGTAAFAIDNYKPLPPKRGTIFDVYPLMQRDDSGGTISHNWIEGTDNIELKASGKGTRLLLIFSAPKADGEYKLILLDSPPIPIKPQTN